MYCSARYSATARCWSGVTTFFGDILEHLFIQEQLGHEPLESLDLDLEMAAPAIGIDLGRVMPPSPAMIGGLGDADLAAEVGDGQSPGQVAIGVPQQSGHFVVGPSLAHGSLPVPVYRGTSISSGPTLGGQAIATRHRRRRPAHAAEPVGQECGLGRVEAGHDLSIPQKMRLLSDPHLLLMRLAVIVGLYQLVSCVPHSTARP